MIDLGDTVPLAADVLDAAGALANALTVTLTLTLPDGTTVTPTVTNPPTSTGHYGYDYPTVQAGPHDARWLFTFTGGLTTAHTEHFDVRPAASGTIISLSSAKTQLNITTTTHDDELRQILESSTEVVERHTHTAVARRTRVDYQTARCERSIFLTWAPVISLTSVRTVDGVTTWNVSGLHVVPSTGKVTILGGGYFTGDIEFIYVAGRTFISANCLEASEMIVQHLWDAKRGTRGGPRPGGMDDTVLVPGMGFAVPRAALELLGKSPSMGR